MEAKNKEQGCWRGKNRKIGGCDQRDKSQSDEQNFFYILTIFFLSRIFPLSYGSLTQHTQPPCLLAFIIIRDGREKGFAFQKPGF